MLFFPYFHSSESQKFITRSSVPNRVDPAVNKLFYQRVAQEVDFARQLNQAELTAYELRLSLALQHHGLPTNGTLEEKLARWNEFLVAREQENQRNQERIHALNTEVTKILDQFGIDAGIFTAR